MFSEKELLEAAKKGDTSVLKKASEEYPTAVLSARNNEGDSIGHIAAKKGHQQIVKLLVENGFDTSTKNKKGLSIIHVAAQNAQLPILKYLKFLKADFTLLTDDGESVLDIAKRPDVISYLESAMALEMPGQSSGHSNKSRRKKEKRNRFSALDEVNKSERVTPSEESIERISSFRSYGDKEFPICDLVEVGWMSDLGFPKRPDWRSLNLTTAEALHSKEEQIFREWIGCVDSASKDGNVSTFERNLEYWRELWRVIERADLCMIVADARNPLLHLNRSLISYISN